MTKPVDFFALEAGECLDRLEVLITQPGELKPAELLRYARALRGSALMANQAAIARAAAGFEGLARAVRDQGRDWDAATSERAAQAVDELRMLVRRAQEWTEADTTRAAKLAADLDALAGSSSGDVLRPQAMVGAVAGGVNTGVRAFVAREGALIASALDRAARTLQMTPEAREPLYAVLRRMQSLRGLAEIGDLTPLPEILDGIELAVGDLTRLFAPPPGVASLLDSAAIALTRLSRDVADRGRPEADPEEARRFTEQLLHAFATEGDVVPIESLYQDGDPAPMERTTGQPQFAAPVPLGEVEIVSYGGHLAQAADRIVAGGSGTARDLRLYALVSTLRSVAIPGPDAITPALARLGRAARASIGAGTAARNLEAFAESLREAGRVLSAVADGGDPQDTGARLDAIAEKLDQMSGGLAAPAAESAADVVSIESLAFDGETVFERRAKDAAAFVPQRHARGEAEPEPATEAELPEADAVVAIETLAPADRLPLERAYETYRQLMRRESRPPAETVASDEPVPVDIRGLCYTGRRALERADEVRAEIARCLEGSKDIRTVEPLVRELLDLVPLALEPSH